MITIKYKKGVSLNKSIYNNLNPSVREFLKRSAFIDLYGFFYAVKNSRMEISSKAIRIIS